MVLDYTVNTEFVDRDTGEKIDRIYPFDAYCNNVQNDLKHVLYEVENICYQLENHKDRDEWTPDTTEAFMKIRKKLLNHANGIARLPLTLHCKGVPINSVPASEFIANMIDNK